MLHKLRSLPPTTVLLWVTAIVTGCSHPPTLKDILHDFELEAGVIFTQCRTDTVDACEDPSQKVVDEVQCLLDGWMTCTPVSWHLTESDLPKDIERARDIFVHPNSEGDCVITVFDQPMLSDTLLIRSECTSIGPTSDECEVIDIAGCTEVERNHFGTHVPSQ